MTVSVWLFSSPPVGNRIISQPGRHFRQPISFFSQTIDTNWRQQRQQQQLAIRSREQCLCTSIETSTDPLHNSPPPPPFSTSATKRQGHHYQLLISNTAQLADLYRSISPRSSPAVAGSVQATHTCTHSRCLSQFCSQFMR